MWVAGPQPYGTSYTTQGLGHYPVPAGQPAEGGYASMMDFRIQKIFSNATRGTQYDEDTTTMDIGLRGVTAKGYEWDMSYTDNTYDLSLIHISEPTRPY